MKIVLSLNQVASSHEVKEFITLPRFIYPPESPWVQPPNMVVKSYLSDRNPFFREGVAAAFVVRRDERPLGRIMAHVWRRHHRLHGEKVGYFGFFECANDSEAANLLLSTANNYVRDHECNVIRGPFNMTGAQEAGIVTAGFDRPPAVDMVYTPAWYPGLLEQNGFRKCLEMQTRSNESADALDPELLAARYRDCAITRKVKVRSLSWLRRRSEMELVREVVNASFLGNWGFVPITREEWELQTGALLPILDPCLIVIATVDDVPIGVTLGVPNFNRVFRRTAGRLLHPAALRLFGRRRLKEVVVILCAVRKQYQGLGVGGLLNVQLLRNLQKSGYRSLSTTWIGRGNGPSVASSDAFDMTCRHMLAMYERAVL